MAVLNVHAWGAIEAPPVLIVHGVRNTGARFRRLAEEGLPERRVIAPDLRGHGHSTWDPPWDAERHVADLLETLDALDVGRAPVVGHSFGGLLAMLLAAAAPERVERLALLDPASAFPPRRSVASSEEDLLGLGRSGTWDTVEEARAAWLDGRPPQGRWAMDEDLRAHLERCDDGRLRFRYSRQAAIVAWSEMARPAPRLAGWSGDALLVVALQAAIVTEDLRAALRADVGDRLEVRDIDAGHMLFWDAPQELADVVGRFLAAPRALS
jgi:lipase